MMPAREHVRLCANLVGDIAARSDPVGTDDHRIDPRHAA